MKTTTTLTLLLLVAVAGCGGSAIRMTAADPDNLGKEIAEALAKVRGEKPDIHVLPTGPRVPVDLSKTVIGIDSWNSIGDPELANAVGEYAKGAYPGGLIDCRGVHRANPKKNGHFGPRCFPLSPGDLPPDGLLIFSPTPWDPSNTVTVTHYDFVAVEDESDGWYLDTVLYSVDVERLEDGGWRVGEARYECCI